MFGDLPPSSWLTRLTVGAARWATSMPARVEPVNEIMSMPGCSAHRRADLGPEAVDEIEHALRHAGLMQDLGEDQRRGRRVFRGLQDHGAAGGKRRRDLAGDLVERPVPRRDHADDADRLAHDHGGAERLLELVVLEHVEGVSEVAEAGAGLQPSRPTAAARPSRRRWRRRYP